MRYIIEESISVSFLIIIFAVFITKMIEMKRPVLFGVVYWLINAIWHIICMLWLIETTLYIKVISTTLIKLLIVLFFNRGRVWKVFLCMTIIQISEYVSELVILGIMLLIMPDKTLTIFENTDARIIARLILIPITFLIVFGIYSMWVRLVFKRTDAIYNSFLPFLASQILMLVTICLLVYGVSHVPVSLFVLLAFIVLFSIVADVFIFRSMRKTDKLYVLEKNMLTAQHQLSLQSEYYKSLVTHMQLTNKLRHDFKNQLQVAYSLFEKEEHSSARLHLDGIKSSLSTTEIGYCGNSIIDAIMMDKATYCKQNEISLSTELEIGNDISVDGLDLCSIVSNMMDNAIAACTYLPAQQREIHAAAFIRADWLVISVSNSAAALPSKKDEQQLLPEHGLGLSIIEDAANKYDGKVETECTSDRFTITVWLSLADRGRTATQQIS